MNGLAVLGLLLMTPSRCLAGEILDRYSWQQFERCVRDGEIGWAEGRAQIAHWAGILERSYPSQEFEGRIYFPLKGYGVPSIGGKNGEGYRPGGYEFLGGNRHKGHPAQDLFIRDRNQDGLDDRTGRPVGVRALADGVVLSTFAEWTTDPAYRHIRGGNYVWIYHPALKLFSYYAHLQDIRVGLGEIVHGGAVIATLGRTGTNANPPRSPTHLHVMLLRATDMTPLDPYPLLANLP